MFYQIIRAEQIWVPGEESNILLTKNVVTGGEGRSIRHPSSNGKRAICFAWILIKLHSEASFWIILTLNDSISLLKMPFRLIQRTASVSFTVISTLTDHHIADFSRSFSRPSIFIWSIQFITVQQPLLPHMIPCKSALAEGWLPP